MYTEPIKANPFKAEKQLTVSGTVGNIFSNKRQKDINLSLITFDKPSSFDTQKTDNLGRFNFKLKDNYSQNLKILIQSADKSGKNKNYNIQLHKKKALPILFDYKSPIESINFISVNYIQKSKERIQIEDDYSLSNDVNQLDEVIVNAYKMTPERAKVAEKYGKPNVVINGKSIQKKEKKWSYGLYSWFTSFDKL